MKSKLTVLFLTVLLLGGPLVLFPTPVQATTTATKDAQGLFSKKKKRVRAYKPRKKKFLGIFKRRSSCDCPKH